MIQISTPITVISYAIGILGVSGGIFGFFRYGNYQTTVKLQNDNIKALQDQTGILTGELEKAKQDHLDSIKAIGVLEGQVKLYKDLQLEKMATAMINISDTNKQILETLQKSSIALVDQQNDGGLLVKTKEVRV